MISLRYIIEGHEYSRPRLALFNILFLPVLSIFKIISEELNKKCS